METEKVRNENLYYPSDLLTKEYIQLSYVYRDKVFQYGAGPISILTTLDDIRSNMSSSLEEYKFEFNVEFIYFHEKLKKKCASFRSKATCIGEFLEYFKTENQQDGDASMCKFKYDENGNIERTYDLNHVFYLQVVDERMSYRVVKIKDTLYVPFVSTFQLQFVEKCDDDAKLNVQLLIIFRCMTESVQEYFEEIVYPRVESLDRNDESKDFEATKAAIQEELDEILSNPTTRINDKPYPLGDDKSNEKTLYIRGKKVGIEITYRTIIQGVYFDLLSDIQEFPFDKQQMDIKFEFTTKNLDTLKGYSKINNLTIKPIIYRLKMDTTSKNKFNIFSVRNDEETGTKNTEALDAYNIHNNSGGYAFDFEENWEVINHKSSGKESDKEKAEVKPLYSNVFIYNSSIKLYIHYFRDPVFELKTCLLPMCILLFFSSGVNFFGSAEDQYSNLLTFYLSFGMFLSTSSAASIKTSKTTYIDMINYYGYVVNISQFLLLVFTNYMTQYRKLTQDTICLLNPEPETNFIKEFISFFGTFAIVLMLLGYILYSYTVYTSFEKMCDEYENLEYSESEGTITARYYWNPTPYINADWSHRYDEENY